MSNLIPTLESFAKVSADIELYQRFVRNEGSLVRREPSRPLQACRQSVRFGTGSMTLSTSDAMFWVSASCSFQCDQGSACCFLARTTSSIPPHFLRALERVCSRVFCPSSQTFSSVGAEVPVPTDFDLSYQDLSLKTPDGVTLRCYLLVQRKELSNHNANKVHSPEEETNEEVRFSEPFMCCILSLCCPYDVGYCAIQRI